ncbi:MAG TPA: dienelactone hydrolase family protein [Geobacteraceae bacterium]|nr:dienelactone hydrolase family protein [Geobacteraceae bacterium]
MARSVEQQVSIPVNEVWLDGTLSVPQGARGVVIFAHGSGSSRLSPRNTFVAGILQEAGLGTLLFDLLTREEDASYPNRFNIDLLAARLVGVTCWLSARPEGKNLLFGYFGASTGAAAALQGAAEMGGVIKAVVSRGGRPDLAIAHLGSMLAPTLLIVGEFDHEVLQLNREAFSHLRSVRELAIVPGATHLFEEPGTLEKAANLARDWFIRYLS